MQAYSDPKRENDPYSLPDVEVFYMRQADIDSYNGIDRADSDQMYSGPGWYYWFCFPGCMPDSEPNGPFTTEDEAIADMRENFGDDDSDDSETADHVCTFGPFEHSRLAGTLHRKCTQPGCAIVSLDADEDDDDDSDDEAVVLTGPITEGQPGQLGPSAYVSQGYDAGSGLYVFLNEDGNREYFAKRTDAIASWGLYCDGFVFEFVRSETQVTK